MGAFVISKRISGEYKFEFTSRKGKTIFTSNNFELRFECKNEIEFLKASLPICHFMKFKTSNNKFFFKLIIQDKQFAISRKYTTELLLQKGIDEILKYGSKSETLDFSNTSAVPFEDLWEL